MAIVVMRSNGKPNVFAAARLAVAEVATIENGFAAKIGGHDFAAQAFAEVRRDCVAIVKVGGSDGPFGVRAKNGEVGVVSRRELAFAGVEAGKFGGLVAEPTGDVR